MENESRHTHPAFGQISFSRVNGKANFYGSELSQNNYIEMTVQQSELIRDLIHDRYFAFGTPLIKVRMSANQFSELITSMNMGGGSCCTVEFVNGKHVDNLPSIENRKEFVHKSFKNRMTEFAKSISEQHQRAKLLIKKKTLSKDDINELTHHLNWLETEITKNIPFFSTCFQETMDNVVQEAKTEIENAIQHKINVLGLEQLHKQNKLMITDGEKTD